VKSLRAKKALALPTLAAAAGSFAQAKSEDRLTGRAS
jgi:hypothetical protein